MITPSYSLTATERILPRLALDFTTATLDSRVTLTRSGNTATVIDSSGVIALVNANLPRFDYNPTTLVCRGLLIEESRANALLNSLIDGTSLATQSVTVTAAARTLSFYGTGQIVLSGAASATVTGTGAYPTRTTLTFTPSAGSLTLTVTGTVQFAQLELGSFATSFIPTAGSAVTRNADNASMTGTNFSDWFNASQGAFAAWFTPDSTVATNTRVFNVSQAGSGNTVGRLSDVFSSGTTWFSFNGSTNVTCGAAAVTSAQQKLTSAYAAGSYAANLNGGTGGTASSATLNTPDRITLGALSSTTGFLNGRIQKLLYWPQRITNAEVQAFSK
jgi:hypothetical protein